MSFNLYYLNEEAFSNKFPNRYEPQSSHLTARSILGRYLSINIKGYDAENISITYRYDQIYETFYVQLEATESFAYTNKNLFDYLKTETKNNKELLWVNTEDSLCTCRLKSCDISSEEELYNSFQQMIDIFDPLFENYIKKQKELEKFLAYGKGSSLNEKEGQAIDDIEFKIVKIKDLDFSLLKIPEYQRTYKWNRKNVSQLIDDISLFKLKSTYRLGTLVLNNCDIVDGQQRIVTISLILAELFRNQKIKQSINENPAYTRLFNSVVGFWDRTTYKSSIAKEHLIKNLNLIQSRSNDLNKAFFENLVNNCEFVLIKLKSQEDAFQFFDSQNSRGKDLDPHDLLKAYHLREIAKLDANDKKNITDWQKIQSDDLISLFLTLYRIKNWSKGKSARTFSKDDINCFKGITLKNKIPKFPFYRPSYYLNKVFLQKSANTPYPFQIDGVVLNGSLFFQMIIHYYDLERKVFDIKNLKAYPGTCSIIQLLSHYDKMNRIGDSYIRSLFDALLIYYVDRFGFEQLDKISELFFLYAYSIRITKERVSIATVDDAAVYDPLFRTIRDATTPLEILRTEIPPVTPVSNSSRDLIYKFESLNKIIK